MSKCYSGRPPLLVDFNYSTERSQLRSGGEVVAGRFKRDINKFSTFITLKRSEWRVGGWDGCVYAGLSARPLVCKVRWVVHYFYYLYRIIFFPGRSSLVAGWCSFLVPSEKERCLFQHFSLALPPIFFQLLHNTTVHFFSPVQRQPRINFLSYF